MPQTIQQAKDRRELLLVATMKRHHYRSDALIEVLHKAQELFGYLDRDRLFAIARALKIPPSRVYGVATFYHLFTLNPPGQHRCVMCLGTACYVKGAAELTDQLREHWDVQPGEVRADGSISLSVARCLGACGLAPVGVLDGEMVGKLTLESVLERTKGWVDGTE